MWTRAVRDHFPVWRVQKLSAEMNVKLVGSQEVCGQRASGRASQPHPGFPLRGIEDIGNLGQLRQPSMLKVWHTHGNTSHEGGIFSQGKRI